VPSSRRRVDVAAREQDADVVPSVTLVGSDETDGTVSMLAVVPVDEALDPRPRGVDGFEGRSRVAASRNHRDRVGCVMPTSCASMLADSPFGPVILSTIRARKPSLYSVISQAYAPPRSRLAEAASILTQGGNEEVRAFFAKIGLKVGAVEEAAMRAANEPAHGTMTPGEKMKAYVVHGRAYRTLFARTFLRLIGYDGAYLDRTSPGFPSRALEEPAGEQQSARQ
jgi:hypothetical protein